MGACSGRATVEKSVDETPTTPLPASLPERAAADRLEQFYTLGDKIGRGHYAVVYEATSLEVPNLHVAVKRVDKKGSKLDRLAAEVSILKKIRHRNIVALVDVFESSSRLDIVLELVGGGELFEMLVAHGAYDEREAMCRAKEIVSALAYLHENGVVHRDLKPENVLLTSRRPSTAVVKIADFGLSKLNDKLSLMKTVCGTWAYCAPEVKHKTGYGAKVDVWSAGVIIYILLVAYHPFDPQGVATDEEMWAKISKCDYNFSDDAWNYVSGDARDLLERMICLNPNERLSANGCLSHTWLGGEGVASALPQTPLSPGLVNNMSLYLSNSKKQAWQAKTPRPRAPMLSTIHQSEVAGDSEVAESPARDDTDEDDDLSVTMQEVEVPPAREVPERREAPERRSPSGERPPTLTLEIV